MNNIRKQRFNPAKDRQSAAKAEAKEDELDDTASEDVDSIDDLVKLAASIGSTSLHSHPKSSSSIPSSVSSSARLDASLQRYLELYRFSCMDRTQRPFPRLLGQRVTELLAGNIIYHRYLHPHLMAVLAEIFIIF